MTSAELRYIIAVDELYGGGRGARLTDVALKMGVTKVSVYKMFERLECRGLMERNALNRIFLTGSGRAELAVNMFCIDYIGKAIEILPHEIYGSFQRGGKHGMRAERAVPRGAFRISEGKKR